MLTIFDFDFIIKELRHFFQDELGFIEVPAQSRPSILAACEDPTTIATTTIGNQRYPLPQTGQMWLEYELLTHPHLPGVFCQTTSYRNEPNPIPGRHDRVFPMFEFEAKGNINDLRNLETELLTYLGFPKPIKIHYEDMCKRFSTNLLEAEHEARMFKLFGSSISLEMFPENSNPFWNMKRNNNGLSHKIDIILYGMETIGSAERSTDPDEMRYRFHTISDGKYAQKLFDEFGKERVIAELEEFLSLPMIPRYGGGIGLTRLHRAMREANIIR
jgi:aspartyl/asparaginyl-tRNA synthetase